MLTATHRRVLLWEFKSSAEKFQHITGAKYRCIEEGKDNSHFIHVTPSLRQQVPRETPSVHSFSHRGDWQHSEWVASFSTWARHCPGGSILPQPTQSTEVISTAERFQEMGAQQHQRPQKLHRCHQEAQLWASWYTSHVDPSHWAMATPMLFMLPAPIVTISLCVPTACKGSLCRWLSSPCRKPAPLCKYEKKHTKLSISWHCCGVNKKKAINIGLTLWDWEKIQNLKNPPSKRYEVSIAIGKVSGSLRVLNWAGEGLSLLKPRSEDRTTCLLL